MNFAFFLHLRYLFLICAFGLLTITPAAQIVSQNFNKSAEVRETPDKNETLEEKRVKIKLNLKYKERNGESAACKTIEVRVGRIRRSYRNQFLIF